MFMRMMELEVQQHPEYASLLLCTHLGHLFPFGFGEALSDSLCLLRRGTYMETHFDSIVSDVLTMVGNEGCPGCTPLLFPVVRLAPLGQTVKVHPLVGNEGAIGLNSLNPCQVRK